MITATQEKKLIERIKGLSEIESIVDSVMDVEEWEEGGFDKLKEAIVKIKDEL